MASAAGDGGSAPPQTTEVEAATAPEPVGPGVMPHEECISGIRAALKHPTVRFLRERTDQAGCPVWPRLLKAATCVNSGGGYGSRAGIKVCCNQMRSQDMINQVLIHELIHAYDDCVAKVDWTNCAQHACSEIRANHLSGDCHFKRELMKGFLKIKGHEPECVKRRALASVMLNPHCSDGTAAKDAVEAAWDICYNDTRPFDRAP